MTKIKYCQSKQASLCPNTQLKVQVYLRDAFESTVRKSIKLSGWLVCWACRHCVRLQRVKWTLTWASSCYLHSHASLLPTRLMQTPPPHLSTNTQGGNLTKQETGACFQAFTWSSRHFDNRQFHANSNGGDSYIHKAGRQSCDSLSVRINKSVEGKKKSIGNGNGIWFLRILRLQSKRTRKTDCRRDMQPSCEWRSINIMKWKH